MIGANVPLKLYKKFDVIAKALEEEGIDSLYVLCPDHIRRPFREVDSIQGAPALIVQSDQLNIREKAVDILRKVESVYQGEFWIDQTMSNYLLYVFYRPFENEDLKFVCKEFCDKLKLRVVYQRGLSLVSLESKGTEFSDEWKNEFEIEVESLPLWIMLMDYRVTIRENRFFGDLITMANEKFYVVNKMNQVLRGFKFKER